MEIHRRMLPQYEQSTMSQRKVSFRWEVLNRVEHMLLMKVVLVGHQHRAAETFLLRRNTETS